MFLGLYEREFTSVGHMAKTDSSDIFFTREIILKD